MQSTETWEVQMAENEKVDTISKDEVVKLTITDPHGKSFEVSLVPGEYVFGRSDDCEIRFPESAKTISRHHSRITVTETGAQIKDLESSGGTMLNGQVISSKELENDDVLTISDYMIRVQFLKERESVESKVAMAFDGEEMDERVKNLASELEEVSSASERLFSEIAKRIVGQRHIVKSVWASILAKGHCLMIGVPGLAKTYMVTTFADALSLSFKRIQFTPDLMPSDIIGSNVIQESDEGKRQFEFVQGPIFTQLLLADEINRTPPKTQAALLEAMQERQVTVANRSLSLPSPFCVIASQNPIEQEGTYPLPEAQQDRFMLCLVLDYPDRTDEVEILINTTHGGTIDIESVLSYREILRYQTIVDNVGVSREMAEYAADLARATRPKNEGVADWVNEMVDWGAGPRAGQALIRTAKAIAAMEGRPAISYMDIQEIALPVLRHRISCNYKARTQDMNEDKVIEKILEEVKHP